jgi:heme exporter protein C
MPHPPVPSARARGRLQRSGLLLAALTGLYAVLVVRAPIDAMQGVIQKILYVHVPCAFAAYLGFAVTALCSALFLWRNDERYDRIALASAEVGVVFCSLVLLTGPIWAKGTWGHWWAWDPRLTVTLLLWFIYLAYLLLRSFTEGSARTARFAAVYGIVGVSAAMHPDNLERGSLGAGMGWPFAIGAATAIAAFVHLVLLRVDLEALRAASPESVDKERPAAV